MRYFTKNGIKARTEHEAEAEKLLVAGWLEITEAEWATIIVQPELDPQPSGDMETRVATLETDVADLTAAVERGLAL